MDQKIEKGKGADEKFCLACGSIIHNTALTCPSCGAIQTSSSNIVQHTQSPPINLGDRQPLISNMKYCVGCGNQVHNTASSCPRCGAKFETIIATTTDKSRTTAGILALLVGGLGVHKFYVGRPILGILYLLFCWTFIPTIVALIEGIQYLTWSDQKFHDRVRAGTA